MEFGDFKVDSGGVSSIFKSAAMQAALGDAARTLTSRAISAEAAHRAGLPAKERAICAKYNENDAAYAASVRVLDNTAIGVVRVHNLWGVYDENQNHTLENL